MVRDCAAISRGGNPITSETTVRGRPPQMPAASVDSDPHISVQFIKLGTAPGPTTAPCRSQRGEQSCSAGEDAAAWREEPAVDGRPSASISPSSKDAPPGCGDCNLRRTGNAASGAEHRRFLAEASFQP